MLFRVRDRLMRARSQSAAQGHPQEQPPGGTQEVCTGEARCRLRHSARELVDGGEPSAVFGGRCAHRAWHHRWLTWSRAIGECRRRDGRAAM
eukprot:scaffold24589_cov113-Isochrysis_galbana.AAC.2